MAKELFAGQRKNKYKIVISKDAISRKNIAPLLKMHQKTLIISDDGVPQNIVKKVVAASKPSTKIFKIIEVVVDLKNIKSLADTCTGGYMKVGIYRHRTIGYWNSDWESLQDQTVYLDSILIRKPKKEEKFKK